MTVVVEFVDLTLSSLSIETLLGNLGSVGCTCCMFQLMPFFFLPDRGLGFFMLPVDLVDGFFGSTERSSLEELLLVSSAVHSPLLW